MYDHLLSEEYKKFKEEVRDFVKNQVPHSMLKKMDKDEILSDPEWKAFYDEYKPDPALINQIKSHIKEELKVEVYLALWCTDSKEYVPAFIKLIEMLALDLVIVDYYSVDRKPTPDTKYYVEDLGVERVATFIFFQNGQEIGRIIEKPEKSLAEDFLNILLKE